MTAQVPTASGLRISRAVAALEQLCDDELAEVRRRLDGARAGTRLATDALPESEVPAEHPAHAALRWLRDAERRAVAALEDAEAAASMELLHTDRHAYFEASAFANHSRFALMYLREVIAVAEQDLLTGRP